MFQAIRHGWRLIPGNRRFMALRVLMVMSLMPVLELGGIGMVFAFVQGVADPGRIAANPTFQKLSAATGIGLGGRDLVLFGVITVAVLIIRNVASSFNQWQLAHFTAVLSNDLSTRLLRGYMAQPILFFAQANTADLSKNVLVEANVLVGGSIVSVLTIISDTLMICVLTGALLFTEPVATLVSAVVLGGIYVGVSRVTKVAAIRLGNERMDINRERYTCALQTLQGVRELKVLGRIEVFLAAYSRIYDRLGRVLVTQNLMAALPRNVLEVLIFGGTVALVTYKVAEGTAAAEIIGLISLYVLAAYRLMPSADRLLKQFNQIHASAGLYREVKDGLSAGAAAEIEREKTAPSVALAGKLHLAGIGFRYPGQAEAQLADIDVTIGPGESIALCGPSGSGKSTLVNIILGLLRPSEGEILVDGVPLRDDLVRGWQNNIGYVPQDIFLTDDTIANNIALGIAPAQVDMEAVVRAAQLAHLDHFVRNDLPDGYDTVVGERGVRLSGGQRQRIGIARALYHDPAVLVLDEATSALDGITESEIALALNELARKKAIVMVAHRLTTVRDCDRIYLLDHGRIRDVGRYDDLMERNEAFRQMARET